MKTLFLLAITVSIFVMYGIDDASASHTKSRPCNISIQGQTYPVMYQNQPRNNPDGTYYSGDAFFYIFKYSASPTCISLTVHPLKSYNGLDITYTGMNIPDQKYMDSESKNKFKSTVESRCNSVKRYSGCISGMASVSGNIAKNCTDNSDPCINKSAKLELTITGKKKVCRSSGDGGSKCSIIPVVRTATISPDVLIPNLDVTLSIEQVQDKDRYDARNLDGTYYLWDPIVVRHVPELLWKNHRENTIHFETVKTPDLKIETHIECGLNSCNKVLKHTGVTPSPWSLGNGDGITMYNATGTSDLGRNFFSYDTDVFNAGILLDSDSDKTDALAVRYKPEYSQYPYPLLSDDHRTSYEDRAAVALHYFGSHGGGPDDDAGIHEDRRSKINDFLYAGAGFDPWNLVLFNETLAWSEARDVGILKEHDAVSKFADVAKTQNPSVTPCETFEETAMLVKAGYCKVYFEYPILDTVHGSTGPRYENATLFNTLVSRNFAGQVLTYLSHYEYRFAESFFNSNLHVRSVGNNGTVNPVAITVDVMPYSQMQSIQEYTREKVGHDSDDPGLAKIISQDVYPVKYSESGTGSLDVKLRRTASNFEVYQTNGNQSLANLDIVSLSSLYFENSQNARLDVPLDVGYGALSPVTIQVTAANMTKKFHHGYVDFSTDSQILINLAKDNTLDVTRNPGSVTITAHPGFGEIAKLYADDTAINAACNTKCTISTKDNEKISITAENAWGGLAHGVAPEFVPEERPSASSNLIPIALFALLLVLTYWVYRRAKNHE